MFAAGTRAEEEEPDAPGIGANGEHVDVTLRLPAAAACGLLRAELDALAAERAAHARDVAAYDMLRARVAVTHFPTYVKLDVGGTIFKTSTATLRAARGSALAAMFSGSGFDLTLNEDGAYFLDRDGTQFRHVLNYLRGAFDVSILSEGARRELRVEADFYNLEGLVRLLSVKELVYSGIATEPETGLFFWLGTGRGTRPWTNPSESGAVRVTSTMANMVPSAHGMVSRSGQYIPDGQSGACSPQAGQYIVFELQHGFSIKPSYYSLRYGGRCNHPSNWTLEAAAKPGGEFVVLRKHTGDSSIQQGGNAAAWPLTPPPGSGELGFNTFRFSSQGSCFHAGCFEMYGTVDSALPAVR
jgi:hypothetical protein